MEWIDQFLKDHEKKTESEVEWYAAANDGAEGPFSEIDFAIFVKNRKLTGDTLIWNSTLSEWISLQSLNHPIIKPYIPDPTQFSVDSIFSKSKEKQLDFWVNEQQNKVRTFYPHYDYSRQNNRRMLAIGAGVIAIASAGYFALKVDEVIPYSHELTSEQIRDIKATRNEAVTSGLTGTIHLLGTNTPFPRFIISTNFKESQNIVIRLDGITGTLVGHSKFTVVSKLIVKDGILVTNPVIGSSVKGIPMGEYKVTLTCENCTDKRGLPRTMKLTEKRMFLGGDKNTTYEAALGDYHFQLKTKARDELLYFRQLGEIMHTHFEDLKFAKTPKSGSKDKKNLQYLTDWNANHGQYTEEFKSITTKYKNGDFFYEKYVYDLNELFRKFAGLYDAKVSKPNAELYSKLTAEFQASYDQLVAERVRLETLPILPNGRPQAY